MIQALLIQGDRRTPIAWPLEKSKWAVGGGIIWLDLQAPTRQEMEQVAQELDLHPSVVRACLHSEHRARLREFKDHILLVLNAVGRGVSEKGSPGELGRWRTLELNVIVGQRYMVTAHPDTISAVTLLFQRYSKHGEGKPATEWLLYTLVESVTAGYHIVLDRADKQMEACENAIFQGGAGQEVVDRLFALKRHVLYLRRVLGPQRDALGALFRREFPMLSADSRQYFLDTYEHTLRLFDLLDTYRDLISSSLDAHLSTVSNRMNEVMKTLTIVSTIMLPLTLITGIFGMNFEFMPLLGDTWGFWATMGFMLLLGMAMGAYFRRRKWL